MCDFYYNPVSPPCRSVQMVAQALEVPLNLKLVNVQNKEHLTPEFLKINPQHTIPTFVDPDGFVIWESRAILVYIAERYVCSYAGNESLYPNDIQKRAVINQRLYFDMGLYQRLQDYFYPIMKEGSSGDPELLKKVEESLEFLDKFLSKSKFVAGDVPTIADYSLIATYSSVVAMGTDLSRFKNISRWYELRTTLYGNDINEAGSELLKEMVQKFKAQLTS